MKTYDNEGRLKSEINTIYTQDGSVITTTTAYNSANGPPISQHFSVRDSRGKITTQNIIGGKLLP